MKKKIKCLNCSGIMEYTDYWGDIYWYECNQCHIIEGSEGSINVSKMSNPLTLEQIKLHRKKNHPKLKINLQKAMEEESKNYWEKINKNWEK